MAMTDTEIEPSTRHSLRDAVVSGLTAPLDQVATTLQQLALTQVTPDAPGLDPQLLARARALTHALQSVVEQLVDDGGRTLEAREPQTRVNVTEALQRAAEFAGAALEGRSVVVKCAPKVTVAANPLHFNELLVAVLEAAATCSEPEIRVLASPGRGELLLTVEAGSLRSTAFDQVRKLVRTIGGSVQRGDQGNGLVVWVPQQRTDDPR